MGKLPLVTGRYKKTETMNSMNNLKLNKTVRKSKNFIESSLHYHMHVNSLECYRNNNETLNTLSVAMAVACSNKITSKLVSKTQRLDTHAFNYKNEFFFLISVISSRKLNSGQFYSNQLKEEMKIVYK